MIASTEHKIYKKLLKKGNGSILKAIRVDKGGGKGLIAGGIILLVFGLPFGGIFALPGLLLIAIGIPLKRKRDSSWLSYYQETTGYSEGQLMLLDRELTSPSVKLVVCKSPGATSDNFIFCFITENYMLINGVYPYVKRLEDIIAVAFSDSTDNWCMVSLTRQDEETMAINLFTAAERKETLCRKIMQELYRNNPNILCGQTITCEGKYYILERDGAEILRLYKDGRTLELA